MEILLLLSLVHPLSPLTKPTGRRKGKREEEERGKERKEERKFFRRDEVFPVTVDDTSPRDIPWPILSRGNGIYRMVVNDFSGIEIAVAFRRTSKWNIVFARMCSR